MGVLDFLTGRREKTAADAPPPEPERPEPPEEPAPVTYTVRGGDSLWAIAERHYGNGREWQRLFDANRDVLGGNPDNVRPGMVLTIP